MLLLEMKNIEHYIQGQLLFKQARPFSVYQTDRIGIVGQNGAGKSTLINILAGKIEASAGYVNTFGKTAMVAQLEDSHHTLSAKSETMWNIAHLENETMSGGEHTRLKIAAALEKQPDILFLDEPTSHLDREGIALLEKELVQFTGAVLIISHDREFLDNVCTSILEVSDKQISHYQGNYSAYKELKQAEHVRNQHEYNEFVKEKNRLTLAMKEKVKKVKSMNSKPVNLSNSEMKLGKAGFQSKKKSMDKAVKAIEQRINRLEVKEKPKTEQPIVFDIQAFQHIHSKTVLSVDQFTCNTRVKQLVNSLSFQLKPGQKCAVTGKNGAGKSTLLKAVVESEHQGIRLSLRAQVGYFSQNLSVLNPSQSILENVKGNSPYHEEFIRTVLARMLFKREEVYKPVSVLSGGERVKTAIAKLLLGNYNFLVLDEPTNYLDIFTREALEDVLFAYPGTILFATHDPYLIHKVATHILHMEDGEGYLSAVDEKKTEKHCKNAEDVLLLEMELSDVIGKLSTVKKVEEKQKLEERYNILLKKVQSLK